MPGLLIIVDYAKVFDAIEWPFIEFCLKLFNIASNVTFFLKLLQTNSYSRVEQNGNFSDKRMFSRGCRKGDQISPTFL